MTQEEGRVVVGGRQRHRGSVGDIDPLTVVLVPVLVRTLIRMQVMARGKGCVELSVVAGMAMEMEMRMAVFPDLGFARGSWLLTKTRRTRTARREVLLEV